MLDLQKGPNATKLQNVTWLWNSSSQSFCSTPEGGRKLTLSLLSDGSNPCVAAGSRRRASGSEGSGSYSLWQWQPTLKDLAPGSSKGAVTSLSAVPSGYSVPQSGTFQSERNSFSLGGRETKILIPFRTEKEDTLFPKEFLYWCIYSNPILSLWDKSTTYWCVSGGTLSLKIF